MLRYLLPLCLALPTTAQAQFDIAPSRVAERVSEHPDWRIVEIDDRPVDRNAVHGVSFVGNQRFRLHNGCGAVEAVHNPIGHDFGQTSVVDLRIAPEALPRCDDVGADLQSAYAALSRRAVLFSVTPEGDMIAQRMWYKPDGNVGGVREPKIRLSPRRVASLGSLDSQPLTLLTGTGLTPHDPDHLPTTRLTIAGDRLEVFDGCQTLTARIWRTEVGYRTTKIDARPGPRCESSKTVQAAASLVLDPDVRVGTSDGILDLSNVDRWASFAMASAEETQPPRLAEVFQPGTSWRIASRDGKALADELEYRIQVGHDGNGTVSHHCGLEQVRLLFGMDRMAITRTGRDAGGQNDFRAWSCKGSDAHDEMQAMQALLDRTFITKFDAGRLALSRDDDGARTTTQLEPGGTLDLSPLFGQILFLVDATGLSSEAIRGSSGQHPPSLNISPTQIGGYSGCNSGGGAYQIVGDRIRFFGWMQTERGCPDREAITKAFFRHRAKDARYEITATSLRATTPDGKASLFAADPPD